MYHSWAWQRTSHNRGTWGNKSIDGDKIVAMTAAIRELKGQLDLMPKLIAAAANGNKDKKNKKGKKFKNKKNKSDKEQQRRTNHGRRFR